MFLFIALLYFTLYLAHVALIGTSVYGDGVFYYSWLRSLVVDRDFHFANEYQHFHVSQPLSPRGVPGNKYSLGPALFWLPSYLSTHQLIRGDGYELPYQLMVGLSSVLASLFGLLLLFRLLCQYFSRLVSLTTVATVALATNLLFYGAVDPVNSHAVSFFAACLYLNLFFLPRPRAFAVGLSFGFLSSIRLQDLLFGLLLIPRRKRLQVSTLFLGFVIGFLPQLVAWQALYGTIWKNPYLAGGETFSFFKPHLLGVLFSSSNGLFLWTPATLLGFVGLLFPKSRISHTHWLLAVFLLELYLIASWGTWWQGASFSGRMLVSSLPLLSFGLASVFERLQKYVLLRKLMLQLIVVPLTVLNLLAIVHFLLKS